MGGHDSLRTPFLFAAAIHLSAPDPCHLARGHAHNDYEHRPPLLTAIQQHLYSVEADIWHRRGDLSVSHLGFSSKGTLEQLYLAPLARITQQTRSVYGDGRKFMLWLDIKDSRPELREILFQVLEEFQNLVGDGSISRGAFNAPVEVVLTGHAASKEAYFNEMPILRAVRDSNDFSPNDPVGDPYWKWYSLDWKHGFRWNGNGSIPSVERTRLQSLVRMIHQKQRKLRFWNHPQTPAFYKTALETGVDLIGSDNLDQLSDSLRNFDGACRP